jgi:hypothetical protein
MPPRLRRRARYAKLFTAASSLSKTSNTVISLVT